MTPTPITIPLRSKAAKAVYHECLAIRDEVDSILERDPAATGRAEVLLLYSGLHALLMHRVAHRMQQKGWRIPARAVSQFAKFLTGIEIHPGATIGKGLFIDHGAGVVIGETAVVGDNCTIYQGVTLGGTGKQTGKRHPTLGDNVMVGAGAKLLGNFTVGSGSRIAAGAVVLTDVPENATAVGVPAKVVRVAGKRVPDEKRGAPSRDLDQVNIPNPYDSEIRQLRRHIALLEEKLGMEPLPEEDVVTPDGSGI
jgi:serine O-acetyltransferase